MPRLFVICTAILNSLIIFGQIKKDYKVLEIPQAFIIPSGNNQLEENYPVLPGNFWMVYSDRNINLTEEKPGGNKQFKSLKYLEKYYPVEIKRNYLHLFKEPILSPNGVLSENAEDYGWIEMDDLLLWSHCLITPDLKRNKRVFIIKNNNTAHLFENTTETSETENYAIAYIIKERKNEVFLSKSIYLSPELMDRKSEVIGWISVENIVQYPHFLFLEPAWQPNVNSDSFQGHSISIYRSEKFVKNAQNGKSFNENGVIISMNNLYSRIDPRLCRFPVLEASGGVTTILFFDNGYLSYPSITLNLEDTQFNTPLIGFCKWPVDPLSMTEYLPTVLLTKAELLELINKFEYCSEVISSASNFIEVNQNMKEIIKTTGLYPGEKLTPDELLNQIRFYYLHPQVITDLDKYFPVNFGEDKFLYLNTIDNKLRDLESIFNGKDEDIGFYSNGNKYFWLPLSYLP